MALVKAVSRGTPGGNQELLAPETSRNGKVNDPCRDRDHEKLDSGDFATQFPCDAATSGRRKARKKAVRGVNVEYSYRVSL
jgi:hypothetical protein